MTGVPEGVGKSCNQEISRTELHLKGRQGEEGCFRAHKIELLFWEKENVWFSQGLPLKVLKISSKSNPKDSL